MAGRKPAISLRCRVSCHTNSLSIFAWRNFLCFAFCSLMCRVFQFSPRKAKTRKFENLNVSYNCFSCGAPPHRDTTFRFTLSHIYFFHNNTQNNQLYMCTYKRFHHRHKCHHSHKRSLFIRVYLNHANIYTSKKIFMRMKDKILFRCILMRKTEEIHR